MKTLEELGISPWPWSVTHYNGCDWSRVLDNNGDRVTSGSEDGFCGVNDASLIAAAPDMFECLRELHYWTGRLYDSGNDESDVRMIYARIADCRERTYIALKKASGEAAE